MSREEQLCVNLCKQDQEKSEAKRHGVGERRGRERERGGGGGWHRSNFKHRLIVLPA